MPQVAQPKKSKQRKKEEYKRLKTGNRKENGPYPAGESGRKYIQDAVLNTLTYLNNEKNRQVLSLTGIKRNHNCQIWHTKTA